MICKIHSHEIMQLCQGDFNLLEVLGTFIDLFEVLWNDPLLKFFHLMHHCGNNANLMFLTFPRAIF